MLFKSFLLSSLLALVASQQLRKFLSAKEIVQQKTPREFVVKNLREQQIFSSR